MPATAAPAHCPCPTTGGIARKRDEEGPFGPDKQNTLKTPGTETAWLDFITRMITQYGPEADDHHNLRIEIERLGKLLGEQPGHTRYQELMGVIAPALTPETMQGFAYHKPHGYAGDYEIIDRIYTLHTTENERLKRWDEFFHAQDAPQAVRNRKFFFINTLSQLSRDRKKLRVLNVGSGPGRDIFEFFENNRASDIHFDCIEFDRNAIAYASGLCERHLDKISFINANVFKFSTAEKYDLVWSAGLFDYLNDRRFVFLLNKLYSYLKPRGVLYVGNFSDLNPTRKYMELFGNWHLLHRNKQDLIALALQIGIEHSKIDVSSEPLGINLFLKLVKSDLP